MSDTFSVDNRYGRGHLPEVRYPTISSWFEANGDFPENFEDDDELRMEWEDQSYDRWSAEHAAQIEEGEYLAWAMLREQDGMDSSREAYDAHCIKVAEDSEPD